METLPASTTLDGRRVGLNRHWRSPRKLLTSYFAAMSFATSRRSRAAEQIILATESNRAAHARRRSPERHFINFLFPASQGAVKVHALTASPAGGICIDRQKDSPPGGVRAAALAHPEVFADLRRLCQARTADLCNPFVDGHRAWLAHIDCAMAKDENCSVLRQVFTDAVASWGLASPRLITNIAKLQPAQDPHQIVNLAPGSSTALFKVLLHTQTGKEGQNHPGELVHIRLRLLSLDIPGNA